MLFLILIAVALFAALSFVALQAGRPGVSDTTAERSRLLASRMLNLATAVQTAVGRLLLDGCSDTQISFENIYDSLHVNPSAPVDKHCHVFNPAGGNVSAQKLDAGMATDTRFYFASSAAINGLGTTCAGSSCAEIVMMVRGVGQKLCEEINRLNGWNVSYSLLPSDTQTGCPFTGTYDCSGNSIVQVIFSNAQLSGKNSVCYNDTVYGPTYTQVILER